nr:MurR/RpiR family transcriptional regulator [uncultured Roseovarius sp.]
MILDDLQNALPALPKKLGRAARYALDNPERIALDSMKVTAEKLGVTAPTLLRLARHFDFETYDHFRGAFKELVQPSFGTRAKALRVGVETRKAGELASCMLESAHQNTERSLAELDENQLSEVARRIRHARRCILFGSGPAYTLASYMRATGQMALPNLQLVGLELATGREAVAHVTSDDVVIGIGVSPYTLRTVSGLKFAHEVGAHTIVLTDRRSSPLAEHADMLLLCETDSPHYYPSMVSVCFMIEMILASVVSEGGDAELASIKTFESARKESNFYLRP